VFLPDRPQEEEFKADIVRAHGAKLRCQGRRRSYEDIKLFTEACLSPNVRRIFSRGTFHPYGCSSSTKRRPFFAGKRDGNYGLSRMCTLHVRQRYNFPVNVFPHAKVAHTYTNGAPGGSSATSALAASVRFRSACIKVGQSR